MRHRDGTTAHMVRLWARHEPPYSEDDVERVARVMARIIRASLPECRTLASYYLTMNEK